MTRYFYNEIHKIKTIKYNEIYEELADLEIKEYVFGNREIKSIPLNILRVIYERHRQALMLCVANIANENDGILQIPYEIDEPDLIKYVVICFWYGMDLPFSVKESPCYITELQYFITSEYIH